MIGSFVLFVEGVAVVGKRKKWELLTILERLNIHADELIEKNTKVPINTLLQHLNTPPTLSKLIVHDIQSFYNSQLNNIHASDFKLFNNQRKIGWDNFSRGRIRKQFTIIMNTHYKKT